MEVDWGLKQAQDFHQVDRGLSPVWKKVNIELIKVLSNLKFLYGCYVFTFITYRTNFNSEHNLFLTLTKLRAFYNVSYVSYELWRCICKAIILAQLTIFS